MSERRHENTWSRRAAVQMLYMSEITDTPVATLIEQGITVFEDEEAQGCTPDKYACELACGVQECRDELDELIDASSENWALSRMPMMDRSILRLAAYEMKHVEKVPASVSINEAVDLAKEFGGEDDSHRFVNGVLGNIAKAMEDSHEAC